MSVYEDFTSVMELDQWDWSPGSVTQGGEVDLFGLTANKPHGDSETDILEVLGSPISHDDNNLQDWLEEGSLSKMLEDLTGMAADNNIQSPSVLDGEKYDSTNLPISHELEENMFPDLNLIGFELLQQLVVNAEELNDSSVSETTNTSAFDLKMQEMLPLTDGDSGIELTDCSMNDDQSFHTVLDSSVASPLSDDQSSIFSSAPVSPISSPVDVSDTSSELYKLMTQPSIPSKSVSSGQSGIRKSKVKTVSSGSLEVEFLSKKEKKKLQNKNAAIRYRMKKKVESDEIKNEENELESKNKELNSKVEELQREILYMKSLMNEVYKARTTVK